MSEKSIYVAAVVILDSAHRVLTVRKRGTRTFMQPGGKPEAGETPAQTALRETAEEIGLELQVEQLEPLGRFAAQAANEAEFSVVCDNFLVAIDDGVAAGLAPEAEIAELQWFALEDLSPCDDVAPLLTERVAPAVRQWLGLSTSPVVKG